jgi:hypothetical protein
VKVGAAPPPPSSAGISSSAVAGVSTLSPFGEPPSSVGVDDMTPPALTNLQGGMHERNKTMKIEQAGE